MRPIVEVSTDAVAPHLRASAWRDWVHEAVVEMDLVPIVAPDRFFSRLTQCRMTCIAPHQVQGSAQRISRGAAEIARSDKQAYYLISQPTRAWQVRQNGQAHHVQPGQSVLIDSRLPYAFEFPEGLDDLSVELPIDWIDRWIAEPHRWLGVPIGVDTAWGRALRGLKEALVPAQLGALPIPDALIEDQLGALLALATDAPAAAAKPAASLVARAADAMREQLASPSLVAADVARQLGVSVRSLHRAFASAGATFAGTLTRLRVDQAARMLASRRFDALTVAEIGRRCGFADGSHFARVFAQHCGTSPSRHRSQTRL